MKKKILYIGLISSLAFLLCITLLVLATDTIPYVYSRLGRESASRVKDRITEEQVVDEALDMALSDRVVMVWEEPGGFTKTVINWLRGGDKVSKLYHYPKAFLFYGLSAYFIENKDMQGLEKLEKAFGHYVDSQGNPVFRLDKVDQIPFGLTALKLYEQSAKAHYLVFADLLYEYLTQQVDDRYGVILYRSDAPCQYVDVIGMTVPFLVAYYKVTKNDEALSLAKKQLDFYMTYGVDKETYIPAHGVDLATKVKTGSINWGRGIGWYLLGLVALNEVTGGTYDTARSGIMESLGKLKNKEGLWTQFPGSSTHYDASSTLMFLAGLRDSASYDRQELMALIPIGEDGRVRSTSGDTYDFNRYSSSFGDSELSQGLLLLLLSEPNQSEIK